MFWKTVANIMCTQWVFIGPKRAESPAWSFNMELVPVCFHSVLEHGCMGWCLNSFRSRFFIPHPADRVFLNFAVSCWNRKWSFPNCCHIIVRNIACAEAWSFPSFELKPNTRRPDELLLIGLKVIYDWSVLYVRYQILLLVLSRLRILFSWFIKNPD